MRITRVSERYIQSDPAKVFQYLVYKLCYGKNIKMGDLTLICTTFSTVYTYNF